MSAESITVELICPACKKSEQTTVDSDEPAGTAIIELPCAKCLDSDETLSVEPVFKNKQGVRLVT